MGVGVPGDKVKLRPLLVAAAGEGLQHGVIGIGQAGPAHLGLREHVQYGLDGSGIISIVIIRIGNEIRTAPVLPNIDLIAYLPVGDNGLLQGVAAYQGANKRLPLTPVHRRPLGGINLGKKGFRLDADSGDHLRPCSGQRLHIGVKAGKIILARARTDEEIFLNKGTKQPGRQRLSALDHLGR